MQHHQYLSERSHDRETEEEVLRQLPTISETAEEIVTFTAKDNNHHDNNDGGVARGNHMTLSTSHCLPSLSLNGSRAGVARHFPASSCHQIQLENTTAPSGHYWIDPNKGCSVDAIRVYCNFSSGQTCLFPTSRQVCSIHVYSCVWCQSKYYFPSLLLSLSPRWK